MHLLRSLQLIPALDRTAHDSARSSLTDALVVDLAEGVRATQRDEARSAAAAAINALAGPHRAVWVRVHPTGTLQARDDIRATIAAQPAGFILPHAQSAAHLRYADALLRDAEALAGAKEGSASLIAVIESAEGLLNAREIARASGRLTALALDGDGYCADMGVEMTREGHELQYARSHIAVCARAAGLSAIDTAYPFTREIQGLLASVSQARAVGMHGKFVITADQATIVNAVFRPTAAEIAYARRLEEAHAEAKAQGAEYSHIDGRIIDAPRARRARRILDLATAIQAREQQAAI